MAKKKKHINPLLTGKQEAELNKFMDDMINLACDAVEECKDDPDIAESGQVNIDSLTNTLGDLLNISGSVVSEIHEGSPYLDEVFAGDAWKRVLKILPEMEEIEGITKELEELEKATTVKKRRKKDDTK